MTDSQIDQRVAALLSESSTEGRTFEMPAVAPGNIVAAKALQSLLDAQRTIDERLLSAAEEARRIIATAEAAAAQVVETASARVLPIRHRAEAMVAESQAATARSTQDAKDAVRAATREAETIVARATAAAEGTVAEARQHDEKLQRQATLRHRSLVGDLEARRDALCLHAAALERFERDYRVRLDTMIEAGLATLQPRWAARARHRHVED